MIEVKRGQVVDASEAKFGEGKNGAYLMVPVKASKGKDKITLWATNPNDIHMPQRELKVSEIETVRKSARQYQDKWFDNYDANCKFEMVSPADTKDGSESDAPFTDCSPTNDDKDLPF